MSADSRPRGAVACASSRWFLPLCRRVSFPFPPPKPLPVTDDFVWLFVWLFVFLPRTERTLVFVCFFFPGTACLRSSRRPPFSCLFRRLRGSIICFVSPFPFPPPPTEWCCSPPRRPCPPQRAVASRSRNPGFFFLPCVLPPPTLLCSSCFLLSPRCVAGGGTCFFQVKLRRSPFWGERGRVCRQWYEPAVRFECRGRP